MKSILTALMMTIFISNNYSQISKIIVPDSVSYITVHTSYWKNGKYSLYNKEIIIIDSNVIIPNKGTELSKDSFNHLLSLFDSDLAWEANLILYDIFNKNSRTIFEPDITEDIWGELFKENDLKYWQSLFDKGIWGDFVED